MNRPISPVSSLAVLAGAIALSAAGPASAQFAPNARPAFGGQMVNTGFMPDPVLLQGQAGGPVNANQINPSCRGYITPQPSNAISTRTGFRVLRLVVSAQQDTTMMVMLPNGQVVCDDDGGEGLNPLLEVSSPPGEIRVWIGAYSPTAVGAPYILGVTELPQVNANNLTAGGMGGPVVVQPPPPPQMGGLQPQLPPAFGGVQLRMGFQPDPHVVAGQAGGPLSARTVDGSCLGWITPQPGHVLNSQTGFRSLRVVVNSSPLDTTLVVQTPDGRIWCNDDGGGANGLNPALDVQSPPGPIRVWVGAYAQGQGGPYTLGFSELGISSSNLPPPGGGGGVVVQQPVVQQPVVVQPSVQQDVVQMQLAIPVTLFGPGMEGSSVVAMWTPRGGGPTQVNMRGRDVLIGGQPLANVPPTMRDVTVTVTSRRDGSLLVRCEQAPSPGDQGQQMLFLVQWSGGPTVAQRWSGDFRQRPPRWAH